MRRALSFDLAPPLGVSLRFFLNVPLFLVLGSFMLAWVALSGAPYIRWNPGILATTHLLVLGVLGSAMLGAMMQIIPVATRIPMLHARIMSTWIHLALTLGTLALASGFLARKAFLYWAAIVLLGCAFLLFLGLMAFTLVHGWKERAPESGEVLIAIRLALICLGITLLLGLIMAAGRGGWWPPGLTTAGERLHSMPDLHVMWGLAGWVGLLVIGVSYQVIPIFQATELYPGRLTDVLAPLVFVLLMVITLAALTAPPLGTPGVGAILPGGILLALCFLAYAAASGWLLWHRKRPAPEPTTRFWLLAMLCLALAAVMGLAHPWLLSPTTAGNTHTLNQMVWGILLIAGFGISVVNGMLYKIIPFLLWHNARRRSPTAVQGMPKVRQFIADRQASRQFCAHFAAVILLVGATVWRELLLASALALLLSALMLAYNMAVALRLYVKACRLMTS